MAFFSNMRTGPSLSPLGGGPPELVHGGTGASLGPAADFHPAVLQTHALLQHLAAGHPGAHAMKRHLQATDPGAHAVLQQLMEMHANATGGGMGGGGGLAQTEFPGPGASTSGLY
jgi:hypothetical protein